MLQAIVDAGNDTTATDPDAVLCHVVDHACWLGLLPQPFTAE